MATPPRTLEEYQKMNAAQRINVKIAQLQALIDEHIRM